MCFCLWKGRRPRKIPRKNGIESICSNSNSEEEKRIRFRTRKTRKIREERETWKLNEKNWAGENGLSPTLVNFIFVEMSDDSRLKSDPRFNKAFFLFFAVFPVLCSFSRSLHLFLFFVVFPVLCSFSCSLHLFTFFFVFLVLRSLYLFSFFAAFPVLCTFSRSFLFFFLCSFLPLILAADLQRCALQEGAQTGEGEEGSEGPSLRGHLRWGPVGGRKVNEGD